jgi:putative transposase
MELLGMAVGKWRKRYRELGLEGLHDELRPSRPRTYENDTKAEVINRTLQTKPTDGSTQWSARSQAAAICLSKTTFHHWRQTFSVQPHLQKHFKLSTYPFFVEKVFDIVGLYLNQPDNAMILCVDEYTQIQALDSTQPVKGKSRQKLLSRRPRQPRPVVTCSSASGRHAAAVVRASGRMTLRSWRSRRPNLLAWS